ncbi:hypothetical protein [Curtobacterium sp. MCSS17_015]|uniref:hypothetical protein n=1 Tax=Curtobacterium sp. MCSS17_015 TaxID=2175666 RepID=UPI000DA717F1|nr:hypothetical protein [Curtobacterium sp. MCSS17_015]WIB26458.1 hypothetical protein DEJ18_15610 [Curtobacterium sp. MCSS17_015]
MTTTVALVLVGASLALTACGNDPAGRAMTPERARDAVVDLVEESTEAVGGDWVLYRGPDAEVCEQPDGRDGARFVYILEREGVDGTAPAADISTVEELWEGKGITTERFVSGGVDPLTGVRGGGGPVNTIGFNAYPQRYSVTGVSTCSDGDVAELRQAE